jgi:hypothetical protein
LGYVARVSAISPRVLFEQVRSTAGWALDGDPSSPKTSFRAALADVEAVERAYEADDASLPYFRALLAAHFCTVATFVPTDVDARIRHHVFEEMDEAKLAAACDVIDEASRWDVAIVSARVVRGVSGHDGEWFSVRAGALGRALTLGARHLVDRLSTAIDEELAREHAVLGDLLAHGDALDVLRVSTTIAHNLGDLSRVAEAWPNRPEHAEHRARYTRLGHAATERFGDRFARAGALNKAEMADENHRFLALRKPRALRRSRDLLLPIGPFFDDWGETIAKSPSIEERERAEIVGALVSIHESRPEQRGCLRALSAIHAHTPGGLGALEHMLPARLRKVLSSGPLRDALKTPRAVFEARMRKRATLF